MISYNLENKFSFLFPISNCIWNFSISRYFQIKFEHNNISTENTTNTMLSLDYSGTVKQQVTIFVLLYICNVWYYQSSIHLKLFVYFGYFSHDSDKSYPPKNLIFRKITIIQYLCPSNRLLVPLCGYILQITLKLASLFATLLVLTIGNHLL